VKIEADRITPQPWKNGGGCTRELLRDADTPVGGDDHWRWRISLADIEVDGPFSPFPGVQRWFAVVAGAGVELDFGMRRSRLDASDDALAFDGTHAPACRLLAGPTRDLNLMLRGVRGVMRRAAPGVPWAEPWPLRGRFDTLTRTLAWGLPAGPLRADGAALWIGIAA